MIKKICRLFMALVLMCFCHNICLGQDNKVNGSETTEDENMQIKITSPAFNDGDMIPKKQSYNHDNFSPALAWTPVPEGTKSLAIICDDPDAPMGVWVHWVIFNLPADIKELPEGIPHGKELKDGSKQGTTDFKNIGYDGPAPPSGVHRYYFKIYALDTMLDLEAGATKKELLKPMEGHILAQGQLMGRYKSER